MNVVFSNELIKELPIENKMSRNYEIKKNINLFTKEIRRNVRIFDDNA